MGDDLLFIRYLFCYFRHEKTPKTYVLGVKFILYCDGTRAVQSIEQTLIQEMVKKELNKYTEKDVLKTVDGTVDMKDVFQAIVAILGE